MGGKPIRTQTMCILSSDDYLVGGFDRQWLILIFVNKTVYLVPTLGRTRLPN